MNLKKRICSALVAAAMCIGTFAASTLYRDTISMSVNAADLSDMPSSYEKAADWIWTNRIQKEGSVEAWDTIYDKIVAGNGTLNYVVRWQSYSSITLEQRKKLQQVLEKAVNDWTDWLVGYENWPYSHVNVKIVGWAVLDKNCLVDLQQNETVYTDTVPYDPTYDIKNNMGDDSMLRVMPVAPDDLFRYLHWQEPNWSYNGSYDNRYDMQLTASRGMIDMGGYGYYWGQQLSDNAVLGLANGTTSVHILEHEVGHGFGFTDFYGGEGASDGFPPGGFPTGEKSMSIMMAGSSQEITDFDGWFARYVWTKISAEEGRFDLSPVVVNTAVAEFSDTIADNPFDDNTKIGNISFAQNGSYTYSGTNYYGGDDDKNLSHYEKGDEITIKFTYNKDTSEILNVDYLKLDKNVNTTTTTTTKATTITTKATTTTTKATTTTTKAVTTTSTKQTTTAVTTTKAPSVNTAVAEFSDTIADNPFDDNTKIGNISFAQNGSYTYSGTSYYGGDDNKILGNYEIGDIISIKFIYNTDTSEIISIEYLDLEQNIRSVKGDVNDDGVFNITDIVIMQKWLLAVPDTTLVNWKAGDLLEDGKLNVFDLCLMKRILIKQ